MSVGRMTLKVMPLKMPVHEMTVDDISVNKLILTKCFGQNDFAKMTVHDMSTDKMPHKRDVCRQNEFRRKCLWTKCL
jgi:hypothetical protein